MTHATEAQPSFQMKGSLLTITVLQLIDPSIQLFSNQLEQLVKSAPKLFNNAPVLLDLQRLIDSNLEIPFTTLREKMTSIGMIPVGVRGLNKQQTQAAIDSGLAIFNTPKSDATEIDLMAKPKIKSSSEQPTSSVQKSEMATAKIIMKPVRSGQQIYANNSDLIVMSSVSQGAEVLADGNIHIYGPMRGRALAGIKGNTEARIFCQHMSAELVSIAGRYMTNENTTQLSHTTPHQICLQNEKLLISPL